MTRVRVAHIASIDLTHRFLLLGQLRRLREEGFEVTAISAPGPWVDDLRSEGIRFLPWRITRAWDPMSDARSLAHLIRMLRRERFHVVHTHTPKAGVLGRVAARLSGVPCIVNTVHGFYATPEDPVAKRLPVLGLEWFAARFGDLELFQSEEDLRWARGIRLVGPSRSVLLGNGIDLGSFDPAAADPEAVTRLRREFGLEDDALVVGAVGRLVAEKGYRELFTAAHSVRRDLPSARFVVVGERDRAKSDAITEEEQEHATVTDRIVFTGWRSDIRTLLAMFDVFVLPSWREGVPRSAIEAAAMGKPLVLTDIRGCREVARDGVEGILVPPRQPVPLARAIVSLLRNEELRVRLGAAARARALARFDEARVADTVVEHYRRLLSRRGLPVPVSASGGEHAAVRLRPARAEDAGVLSRLHRETMPTAFLPTLGDRFLRQLYRALASDAQAIALVAEDREGILGFATGVSSVRAFYRRFVLRHGVPVAAAVLPALTRPGTLLRVKETLAYPKGAGAELPDPELLSIAVAPRARARGVGRALVEGVVRGLGEGGAEELKVVVGADNDAANALYESAGFHPHARISVHAGVPSNVWTIRCRS
jgi:glycosyltransferase involved in cell wall biosynthesis/ribosomal protein S18 acetylase RimI-like enzyme